MQYLTFDQINTLASNIRRYFNKNDDYMIDITALARDAGFQVFEVDFSNDQIAGTLSVTSDSKVIKVNQSDSEARKRFTIAHELAHGFLHDDGQEHIDYRQPLEYYQQPEDFKKEFQANMLAAALLMPVELVKTVWYKTLDVDDIAEAFFVSKRAAVIRLETLGLME